MSRIRVSALLSCLATTLILAPAASARTYWVSPSGVGGAAGTDSISTPTTLAWFNANAAPGDVCRFKSGTYADPINPAKDGTSSARIRYYGFPNDPGAVVVSNIRLGYQYGDFTTVRWVTCLGGATGLFEAAALQATDDSLVACRIYGQNGSFHLSSKRSVLDSLLISGTVTAGGQNHFISIAGERNHNNGSVGQWSVGSLNNRFTNSTVNLTLNTPGDFHVVLISAAGYNTIAGNTFNVDMQNCGGYFFGVEQYEGYSNRIEGNTWNFAMNGPIGGSHGMWCHRDSSSYNRYVNNRVAITGSGADLSFMLSNGGSFPATTGHNYYGNNYIDVRSPQSGTGIFWYYDGCRQDTVEYNTFITSSTRPCLLVANGTQVNGLVSRHNTYVTAGPTAIDCASASAVNSPRLSSDIFYCRAANGPGAENVRLPAGMRVDSAGVFFSPAGSAGRAISYAGSAGAPGGGGNYGTPGMAVWGSPQFVDSTYATFDGRVASGGAAVSTSFVDGFAGAYPVGTGSDVTPPATVNDLRTGQSTPNSITVEWTAPGDDGVLGIASLYDLRWSTAPITTSNFGSATPVQPQPVPATPGTPQTYSVAGLAEATTYYFAIRTRDDGGNWSDISPSASGATLADTVPPSAIQDLSASP